MFVTITATLSYLLQKLLPTSFLGTTSSRAAASTLAKKPKVVFVLGGPGSGKGTQCAKIVSDFGFVHLSAGDLLREERKKPNSANGALIEQYIKEGKIVPVQITCSLLSEAMEASPVKNFLIDGFPRNRDNLDGWNSAVGPHVDVEFVLFFDCPESICVQRVLQRGITSGRTDDNIESVTKRFKTYESETKPIIEYYEQKGLVRQIDSTRPADAVFADVHKLFSSHKW